MDIKALSNLGRFKDIVFILLKYGFEDLVERLDLPGRGMTGARQRQVASGLGSYERLRMAFEELGPTFVKMGQIMSLRPDLLPPNLIVELEKLQDDVAEVDFSEARKVIDHNLGKPLESVFPVFDPEPIAAASLSQVYRAALTPQGPAVAVKVQRPNIRHTMETDLNIFSAVAKRIHQRFEEMRLYDLPELVRVTRRTLMRELDFNREARYLRIAKSNMADQPGIYIPDVYQEYCTAQLLVMEHVKGDRLKKVDLSALEDAHLMARIGLRAGIKQIFGDGFFHADPHPGNLILMEDHRYCLVDWGMVGRLTAGDRYDLVDMIRALADRDGQALLETVVKMSVQKDDEINTRSLERELLEIIDLYAAVPIKELNLGNLLLDITETMREHRLGIRPDMATMIKALITLEGVARSIYPDLDVVSEAEPYVRRIAARRHSPKVIWRNLTATLSDLFTMRGGVPRRLAKIVQKLEHGKLHIRFEHENLQGLQDTFDNIANRLTFGIIIGALIIGSSMIITTGVRPYLFGYPAFGIIGYVVSAILGLWLVFNIIRSRNY